MATHADTTPAPTNAHYVPANRRTKVTLHQPGKTARSPHKVITGRLLGEMHMRGGLHHYRVVTADGVLYLAPPRWLALECRLDVARAGLTVLDDMASGMFVDAINALAVQWADEPEIQEPVA